MGNSSSKYDQSTSSKYEKSNIPYQRMDSHKTSGGEEKKQRNTVWYVDSLNSQKHNTQSRGTQTDSREKSKK